METETKTESPADAARYAGSWFVWDTRHDGSRFCCLKDGAPEWLHDAIREAHGDLLPDDGIYARCESALEHIQAGGDDDAHEWADGDVNCYHARRVAWLAEHPIARLGLCEEAQADGMVAAEADILERIAAGWYLESVRIYAAMYAACEEYADDCAAD